MTEPDRTPRWQALQVGPGGLPADQVRPSGPGAPWSADATEPVERTPAVVPAWARPNPWAPPPATGNRAPWTSGSSPSGSSRRTAALIVTGVVLLGLVIAAGLWANSHSPISSSGNGSNTAVGDCLSSSGQRIVGKVACTSAQADYAVVGVSPKSSDASDCSATPSDVVVVATGPTVLCLDYITVVGQCLFAGQQSTQVGKVDCDSSQPGVLRVLALVSNSINPDDCPSRTVQTLVHRYNSQVVCLGTN